LSSEGVCFSVVSVVQRMKEKNLGQLTVEIWWQYRGCDLPCNEMMPINVASKDVKSLLWYKRTSMRGIRKEAEGHHHHSSISSSCSCSAKSPNRLDPDMCENDMLSGRGMIGAIDRQGAGEDDREGIVRVDSSPMDTSSKPCW
jgi:hypothetical protein